MKNYIYIVTIIIAFTSTVNAQVGIETNDVSEKAILDFPDNADGGILLPYVTNPASTAGSTSGTILYRASDGIITYHDNGTANWVPMTPALKEAGSKVSHDIGTFPELGSNGVVISNTTATSSAVGVLVLESNDKALALPKVDSVDKIESPKAGMICYDKSRKALAIFNGEHWLLRN